MKNTNKAKILIVSLLLVIGVSVGGTLAYLFTSTDALTNVFKPSAVACEVELSAPAAEKSATGKIKNTGNIAAYIRAEVIATWQDGAQNIWFDGPAAEILAEGWTKHTDGYYYWPTPVAVGAYTGNITVSTAETAPEGYGFTVEIAAQAVQSLPAGAVADAWGTGVPVGEN